MKTKAGGASSGRLWIVGHVFIHFFSKYLWNFCVRRCTRLCRYNGDQESGRGLPWVNLAWRAM